MVLLDKLLGFGGTDTQAPRQAVWSLPVDDSKDHVPLFEERLDLAVFTGEKLVIQRVDRFRSNLAIGTELLC